MGFKEFLFNLRRVSEIPKKSKLSLFSAINTINSSKWKVREEIFKWKKDMLGDVPESKKGISSGSTLLSSFQNQGHPLLYLICQLNQCFV